MKTRVVSGIIGFILLLCVVTFGGILLDISLLIIALFGLKEYHNAIKHINNLRAIELSNYLFTFFLFTLAATNKLDNFMLIIFVYMILILLTFISNKDIKIESVGVTLLGGLYIPFFIYHISFLKDNILIWLVFITAFATDTFAYFIGVKFGKRKIFPNLSPKKSLEGVIGGIVGSFVVTMLFVYYFDIGQFFKLGILSIVCSVLSIAGDLTASRIKRLSNLKDYGNIMPGHGGILDRFDSILFTAPIVYYYVSYIL